MSKITLYQYEGEDSPPSPPANQVTMFAKNGLLYAKNSEGSVSGPGPNPEYRSSMLVPVNSPYNNFMLQSSQLQNVQINERKNFDYGTPVSDPNAGSIVGTALNVVDIYSYNEGEESFPETVNLIVYINDQPSEIVISIPLEINEPTVYTSIQTAGISFGDTISIQTEEQPVGIYIEVEAIATVTISSAAAAAAV